ncbi:protocadherin-12 isoform X2 [Oryzias latipes]|uniref:protocadherin-12 isoform X2 n=1 Tax=Oryzias latipes TaxID=8090 RepID=UPI000CE179D0|nr:protocadherin-12 isoform X2 [Oryzias latipes]
MRFLLTPVVLLLALPLSLSSETLSSESSPITIQYRVWEEQPAGTQVGCLLDDLRRSDEGGSLEEFQVLERGKALPFSVSTRDGVVSTQGRLDREQLCRGSDLCEVAFSVLYRKSGAVNCLRVRVEVMDLNDHSPSFPSALQEVEISETASLGMRIPLERAVDPDAGTNGLQAYTLSTSLHFVLEVTNAPAGIKQAELVVIKELDRELQDSFDLTMVAWDKGNPAKSGTTSIRVLIQDSNDNSPKFEDSYPTVTIPEDTALGTTIIKLRASDPDLGPNGEVDFLLSKLNLPAVQKCFYVDSQTGDLIVQAPLDYEVQSSYEVIIQAVDHGPNAIPAHCKVQVELMDVNDNAPRIHTAWTSDASDAATVMETAPVGTFVAMVTVNDADSRKNGEVSLAIKDVSVPFRLIKMYGNIYKVVTDGSLDREKVMHYNVTLLAQDHGSPLLVSVEQLGVSVLDDNDNAPVFSANIYRATLKENSAAENSILQLKAHDEDLGLNGRVSYYIGGQNEEIRHTHFTIHPRSGVIRVQQPLDYEERSSYSFIVGAVDHGHPPLTGTTTVQIDIEDVNDNHPVIKEPEPRKGVASVSIPVNAHKGEIVTEVGSEAEENPHVLPINPPSREGGFGFLASTIKAEDLDSGLNGQLQFFITEGNQFGLFWLDQATGQLYVNTTNVTELIGRSFRMGLTVTDMGTPTLDTTVTLEVAFINLKDHLRNSSPGNRGQLSFTMMIAICLGSTCLLLLLAIALVTTFCRTDKRDNRAYNCRQAESSYTRHPRRPQKSIRKSDIQLIPVIRGRKEEAAEDDGEAQPLTPPPLAEDQQPEGQYSFIPSAASGNFCSQGHRDEDAFHQHPHHGKSLWKPGNIELDGVFPLTPATSYATLRQGRNPSSSSSSGSHSSTLKRYKPEGKEKEHAASQATLRRPKMSAAQDAERQRMLRDLVRLSMVFGDSLELSSASPEVQISQLLSLLRQGQLQPRPNFRGNKYSHRSGRYGGQDGSDWQSTKDSGHGESEAGDVDWEPGRESPIDPQIEEGLHNLLNNPDGVFSQDSDPSWMARLSVPLTADYHDNVFVPDQPPSSETDNLARGGLSSSSSFSTFGKTPEKDGPLGGALLSEVSTLFEMLMTQKADAHPGPRPDVLYRLSAAYRRSVGLDAAAASDRRADGATHSRPPHKPAPHD